MHGGSHAVWNQVATAQRAELERVSWAHLRGGFCRRCMTLMHALGHAGRRPLLAGVSLEDRYSRLPLTRRETELVQRLGRGQTTKEAAFDMGVAQKTAYAYRYRAMKKLRVHTFLDLIKAAVGSGIISAEEILPPPVLKHGGMNVS